MPNWCENNLTVRGPEEEIKRFLDGIKVSSDKDGDNQLDILDCLYPQPEELENASGGPKNDWGRKHWGTKWGDCYTDLVKKDPENLLFYFESAWSPPVEGFTKVAKDFPELLFYLTYEEPGMCFEGYARWMHGDLIAELSQDSQSWPTTEYGQNWREEKKQYAKLDA